MVGKPELVWGSLGLLWGSQPLGHLGAIGSRGRAEKGGGGQGLARGQGQGVGRRGAPACPMIVLSGTGRLGGGCS